MDPQQQNNHNSQPEDVMNVGNECGKLSTNNYICKQSSARWTPTTDQIKLLKELYYTNGLRSPTADQIHTICARLKRYGKVEGKNVFYWFQNHKARERQKKRFTSDSSSNSDPTASQHLNNNIVRRRGLHWKQAQDLTERTKHTSINNFDIPLPSFSAGVVSGGAQLVGRPGYGAVTMEKKEFSKLRGGVLNRGSVNSNLEWDTGYNIQAPTATYLNFLDKISVNGEDHDEDQDHDQAPEIETLPLFPLHSKEHHDEEHDDDHHLLPASFCPTGSDSYYLWDHGSRDTASLELSLNSYGYSRYSQNV